MTDEKISIRLANQVSEIGRLSEIVNEFAQLHQLTDDALFAINLALEEILINVIKHGYDDTDAHEIAVRFWLSGNNFTAEIADDGVPFDPLDLPAPDITKPLEERQIGGLGVHLIRNMMDKVEYRRRGDNNILVVTKKAK
jgi:serine/threonine-protein kinase RsbW